jgi:altronate hydrolase
MKNTIVIDPRDTVAVALTTLEPGVTLGDSVKTIETIPAKHKVALRDFNKGDLIHMYGVTVGIAETFIPAGGLLTTKNIDHEVDGFSAEQRVKQTDWMAPDISKWAGRTFDGYHRSNGKVGTANNWLVIPLVFCENRNIAVMREAITETLGMGQSNRYESLFRRMAYLREQGASQEEWLATELPPEDGVPNRPFPNVDGVKFLLHGQGCGGIRQDSETLCGLLAGYITHPNVAGATVLSLGCQSAEVRMLEEEIAKRDPGFDRPLHIHTQQKSASEQAMLTKALKEIFVGLHEINQLKRKPAPLSKLTIGMECGGSDGFSGLSANPVLGHVSDTLVALGGIPILSEFPELCGVERELLNRCVSDSVAERFQNLMNAYSARAEAAGSGFYANPSPGNIADGLITDAIKSAGAAKKGGTSPIVDVLDYPEPVTKTGLNLLCTPGGDVESTTAMAGSGANLIIFTTGLGTPTGNAVAPTIKVATNSELAKKMSDIIDFDAGPIIRGEKTIAEMGDELFEMSIQVASGKKQPHAVRLGQDDFIPWKRAISL